MKSLKTTSKNNL